MSNTTSAQVNVARQRFIGQYVSSFLALKAQEDLQRCLMAGVSPTIHPPIEDALYQAEEAWIALLDMDPKNVEFWLA